MARYILVGLIGAFMAAALSSCQKEGTTPRGSIILNEEIVAVRQDEVVTFTLPDYIRLLQVQHPAQFSFQWCRNGEDIAGQTGYSYSLGKAKETDGIYFSCRITNEDLPEPIILQVGLSVNLPPKAGQAVSGKASVATPVTGPLQSGVPSSPVATNSCIPEKCIEYAQFKSSANNSYWWGPALNSVTCTAEDTSGQILKSLPPGYDAMLVVIQGQKNAGLWTYSNYCSTNPGTNSSVIFPVVAGDCYQFILCLTAPPPPPPGMKAGQTLEVTFTGGW